MTLNILSLFSGIGGLELGLERAGMRVVGQVEIDEFCRRVLAKHWPEVPRHDDVRTAIEWWSSQPSPAVDLICGGFPCQDISDAHTNGERLALRGSRSGLWVWFCRAVAEFAPGWVLIENVAAWRRWVPDVRADLAGLGYSSLPLEVPAGAVGAPHRRPRVILVAHSNGDGESLRTIHEEASRLRPIPRDRGHWRHSFAGPVRVADGLPDRVDRIEALGNSVVPQVSEAVGRLIVDAQLAYATPSTTEPRKQQ